MSTTAQDQLPMPPDRVSSLSSRRRTRAEVGVAAGVEIRVLGLLAPALVLHVAKVCNGGCSRADVRLGDRGQRLSGGARTIFALVLVAVAVDKVLLVLELEHEREDEQYDHLRVHPLAKVDDRRPLVGDRLRLMGGVPLVEARDEAGQVEDLDVGLLLETKRVLLGEVGEVRSGVAICSVRTEELKSRLGESVSMRKGRGARQRRDAL
jgi:hypothetical protein